ncbi:hypothetical protein AB0756_39680 [Tolypothrix campylonemoides VB511288_2]|uniref:Uncharacterized protein n=2 Tax=Tolypothrix TaxID=111782 RepID=A0A0C1QLG9_9CYAN
MDSSEVANFLRIIADAIDSKPEMITFITSAIKEHSDKIINSSELENSSQPITKQSNTTTKKSNNRTTVRKSDEGNRVNGEVLLSKSREILRGQGEEQLRRYLIAQGDNIREILRYGHLDPNNTIRRRRNLNSIIEHIISTLISQDKSGTLFAKYV